MLARAFDSTRTLGAWSGWADLPAPIPGGPSTTAAGPA